MILKKDIVIKGADDKPILLDYGYEETNSKKAVVVLAHGFKGFKDWGHFNEVMKQFIKAGFVFVKFNFSHNGGTISQPIDFPDLEAFANNNLSKELADLKAVIDWIENNDVIPGNEINKGQIGLMGHSRGGGVAILGAAKDKRIKKLITWAAVPDFIAWITKFYDFTIWKKEGVIYMENSRTKQQMPLYYQFVEDLLNNKERLDIKSAEGSLTIPHLIIHGSNDEVVPVEGAYHIHEWNPSSELLILDGAGHTFGVQHPFIDKALPLNAKELVDNSIAFFNK